MHRDLVDSGSSPLHEILPVIQDRIINGTGYIGVPTLKNPLDFWGYQEIIHQLKPDVIVEIGNHCGGSALALVHLLDNIGHGRIIAVDIDQSRIHPKVRERPRIKFTEGDAHSAFERMRDAAGPDRAS